MTQMKANRVAAETLLHELVHVQMEIDKALDSAGQKTYIGFKSILGKARKSKPGQLAYEAVLGMNKFAAVQNAASAAEKHFEWLVNEKVARKLAGNEFGSSYDNKQTATTYVKNVGRSIWRVGKIPDNDILKKRFEALQPLAIKHVVALFSFLDRQPDWQKDI